MTDRRDLTPVETACTAMDALLDDPRWSKRERRRLIKARVVLDEALYAEILAGHAG